MDRVVIPIFYFLIIWRMKPAPINWQYLEISFLDCQSANQASQTNDVFIHPFKLEKCKLILIVSLTRINELLNTIWSWNKNIRRLHSVLELRFLEASSHNFLVTIVGIGWKNLDPGHQLLSPTLSPTSTVANSRYQHWCKIDKEWEILIFENQTLKNQNLEDALFALIAAPVDHELI